MTNKRLISSGIAVATLIILGVWFSLFEIRVVPRGSVTERLTAAELAEVVAPEEGFEVGIVWGDTGKKLVESGAIDLEQYLNLYGSDLDYLTETVEGGITINQENAYFWVNTLWALGLVQRSEVLDEGIMGTQYGEEIGNFASTGGWTLGTKDAVELYSSAEIIPLTQEQHAMVMKITDGIYRPCCNNPASFPDCNHGMAILGLVELMVSQGFSEEEIYEAALAFNSYWFTDTYVDLAYYFATEEGTPWSRVAPQRALSAEFSSASGYMAVKEAIGTVPGASSQGASCGA